MVDILKPGEMPIPGKIYKASIPVGVRSHKEPKYPFDELEIGGSFYVPAGEITKQGASNHCSKWGKRFGRKFRFKLNDNGLVQFWRVS